jgi:beta-ribofuranosylaminobenzene 5'-phosphate synthase
MLAPNLLDRHDAATDSMPGHRTGFSVRAPGRLHLGFLDPSGTLGRHFGSLGLTIEGFETELEIGAVKAGSRADELSADNPAAHAELERSASFLQRLRAQSGCVAPLALRLRRVMPAHAGLGSGTQLALAIGRAFALWHGLDVSTPLLAQWLGRGQRSGVGIAGFDQGGLLLDGGPSADGAPALLLSRLSLPPAWRIVVATDEHCRGLSGAAERQAIASLPPLPQAMAADICHQVLMRVLPGAAAAEFAPFAQGINRVQGLVGAHFAPAQGGSAWTSAAVGALMEWLRQLAGDSGAAIGQSSWGPTGFAILPGTDAAQRALAAAHTAGVIDARLTLRTVAGRDSGAVASAIASH